MASGVEEKSQIKEPILDIEDYECPVCLQTCIHPVRLPCSHIFCFLCVKGVANQSKKCALCRKEIPADFLDNPDLIDVPKKSKEESTLEIKYQWFYEGRNGWWQYDERTSYELEKAYTMTEKKCEVLVAGFLYVIDFEKMLQQRRNDPSRRRRIKRDVSSALKKGVAGIKLIVEVEVPVAVHDANDSTVNSSPNVICDENDSENLQEEPENVDNSDVDEIAAGIGGLTVETSPQYYPLDEYEFSEEEQTDL